jgi:hypothetical protein
VRTDQWAPGGAFPCRNAYRPPSTVYAAARRRCGATAHRSASPRSCPARSTPVVRQRSHQDGADQSPKNSDLGIGRPPRGQPGVGVGALLAAVLTAWLHHLTATDGRLIGHGIRAGPAMITTLRWRLLAVPGPPDPSRPPDHPAPTARRRPARPRSSPCLNRPDQAERPQHSPETRSPEANTRAVCAAPHPVRPDQHQLFEPSLA